MARADSVQTQSCSDIFNWQLLGGTDAEPVNTEAHLYTLYILQRL